MTRQQGRQSVHDPKPAPQSRPFLHELYGMAEARLWGEELNRDLQDYFAGRVSWADIDPGCVLYGLPGTGKTTFAIALAATCQLPLVSTTFGDWQSSGDGHLGDCLTAIDDAFNDARQMAPCIFFVDELDSLPVRKSGERNDNYYNAIVNHVLKRLDALKEMKGVVIVGACNHPNMLDKALVRAGRFDRMIEIPLPSLEDIPKILCFHLGIDHTRNQPDLSDIAVLCQGMSGAELEKLTRSARRIARRSRRDRLVKEDLRQAVLQGIPERDPAILERLAVHEAGHAIAAIDLGFGSNVSISLAASGGGGVTTIDPLAPLFTRHEAKDQITILLAGRAAEKLQYSAVSCASGGDQRSDLFRATTLALDCVTRYGLSKAATAPWLGASGSDDLCRYPAAVRREVVELLGHCEEEAKAILQRQIPYLRSIKTALLRKHALSYSDIVDLAPKCCFYLPPKEHAEMMNAVRSLPNLFDLKTSNSSSHLNQSDS